MRVQWKINNKMVKLSIVKYLGWVCKNTVLYTLNADAKAGIFQIYTCLKVICSGQSLFIIDMLLYLERNMMYKVGTL